MRVNMDSSVASDPRFKLLGRKLGISWREAIGSCFLVWLACYERRSELMSELEMNTAAEVEAFASAFVSIGLGDFEAGPEADNRTVLVHGVFDRIQFLEKQKIKGAKGGKHSGKSRRGKRIGTEANAEANGSGVAQANTPPPALTLSPPLTQTPPHTVSAEDFARAWNGLGKPFPQIQGMGGSRLKHFHTRSREPFWLENWRKALEELPHRSFLRGEGDRGWVADADWFLKPDSVRSIIEGKYANGPGSNGAPRKSQFETQDERNMRRTREVLQGIRNEQSGTSAESIGE